MIFYNAVLNTPIGKFPVGSKFDSISIDFGEGILSLCTGQNFPHSEYKLSLLVGVQL